MVPGLDSLPFLQNVIHPMLTPMAARIAGWTLGIRNSSHRTGEHNGQEEFETACTWRVIGERARVAAFAAHAAARDADYGAARAAARAFLGGLCAHQKPSRAGPVSLFSTKRSEIGCQGRGRGRRGVIDSKAIKPVRHPFWNDGADQDIIVLVVFRNDFSLAVDE